jgi:hypothetical protein
MSAQGASNNFFLDCLTDSATIFIWGAQLELGSTASTYQQIVTPEISFLQYQSQPVLFQDSAGTTPVTAVEQAVGLMLDKSKGLVLGSELVTNGDFSQGTTGWTNSSIGTGTATFVNNTVVLTGTDSSNRGQIRQSFSTTAGVYYKISVTHVLSGGGNTTIKVGTAPGAQNIVGVGPTTSGNYTQYFVAQGTTTWLELAVGGTGTLTSTISLASIQALPGNHAFQTTSAKRPVLRARYNLLTYSEQFDNAGWTKTGATVTANAAAAPNGSTTADKVIATATTAYHGIRQSVDYISGVRYTISVYAKAAEYSNLYISDLSSETMACSFDLQAGTAGTPLPGRPFTTPVSAIENVGNGWYRCTLTGTANATVSRTPTFVGYPTGATLDGNGAIYTGDGTSGLFIWGADLRPTSQATGLIGPTYQRIAAATDYDVVGFLPYLQFDGFDDALTTNSIDFSATDKVTLWAGVRKLSDAAAGVFAELSASVAANNGAFALFAPDGAAPRYLYQNKGTASGSAQATGYAAPITNVLTGIGDIAGDVSTLRVDGVQAATSATDQGTGNYGNYPLFIGARNQTSLYFNGWLTQLIGRGAATAAGQISATEQWVGQRTGVQL